MAPPETSPNQQNSTRDDAELMTGEAVALDLRPTGFVLRAAGSAIDFLVYIGGYLLLALLVLPLAVETLSLDEAATAAGAIILLVLALIIAPTAVEVLSHGKSLGKLAVGGRIVRDDGGAIGFRHALIRSLTAMLEIVLTVGGLAAVVGLLNSRTKRLGDMLAGTYSQYERVAKEIVPTRPVPEPLYEWSLTADVARLPDRLSRRVTTFLRQAASLTPATRARLAHELADETRAWVSPLPYLPAGMPFGDEMFLAAVSAMRREREATALELERVRLDKLTPALKGLPHGFPER
jgi:uncharacterized RDD family membrane protein YckC